MSVITAIQKAARCDTDHIQNVRLQITRNVWAVAILYLIITTLPVMGEAEAMGRRLSTGLEGYCPVELIDQHRLVRGQSGWSSRFDGTTYHFSSRAAQRIFNRSPRKYVPALGGDCVVCYVKTGERIPGRLRYASLYEGRIYLFPTQTVKQIFDGSPETYADVDLVANGNSIVWLIHGRRQVAGTDQFGEVYHGLRYLFASPRDQAEFRRFRKQYERLGMLPELKTETLPAGPPSPTVPQRVPDIAPPQLAETQFPDRELRRLLSINSLNSLLN